MTDRFHSLCVVLERDLREDDAEAILQAIRMIRGVASVSGVVSDMDSNMAEVRARLALSKKLMSVIYTEAK